MSSIAASLFTQSNTVGDIASANNSTAYLSSPDKTIDYSKPTFTQELNDAVEKRSEEQRAEQDRLDNSHNQDQTSSQDAASKASSTDAQSTDAANQAAKSQSAEAAAKDTAKQASENTVAQAAPAPVPVVEEKKAPETSVLQKNTEQEQKTPEQLAAEAAASEAKATSLVAETTSALKSPTANLTNGATAVQTLNGLLSNSPTIAKLASQLLVEKGSAENNSDPTSADRKEVPKEAGVDNGAGNILMQNLMQLVSFMRGKEFNSPTSDSKTSKNSDAGPESASPLTGQGQIGTGYATQSDMLLQNIELANEKAVLVSGETFLSGLRAEVGTLSLGVQGGKELEEALKSLKSEESALKSSLLMGSSSQGAPTTASLVSDTSVSLTSNDQFVEVIQKALMENPVATPSRIQVALSTPYGAQVTVYFMQVGNQVRAQLSANDSVALHWLQNQLNDLRGISSAQAVIWLPPQMESSTSMDTKQSNTGSDSRNSGSQAQREAKSLDLDEVLATTSGEGAGSGSSDSFNNSGGRSGSFSRN